MHAFIAAIDKKFHLVEYFLLLASGITVFFIMCLVTFDVIMRNVFNKPLIGVFEVVGLLLIGVIVFGFSYVQGKKEHIIVEVATNSLPQIHKNILDLIGYIIGFSIISIITYQSILDVHSSILSQAYTMGLLKLPLWPSKFLLSIGMITLTIRLLIDVLLLATNIRIQEKSLESTNTNDEFINAN